MMKKLITLSLLLLAFFSLVIADAVINEFRIDPGMNKVILSWKVTVETNVKGYKIQRGFSPGQLADLDFLAATPVAIQPGMSKNYTYTDKSIFKHAGRTFYYRINVIDRQDKVIATSPVHQVSPQISAVRHTWGSIKAMFR